MELTAMEMRILGCLVEKESTTPDNYPLSSNALTNACNQKSNRDPQVNYSEAEVDTAVRELRVKGLARTITGGRANKHRHILNEAWALSSDELSVLAIMLLRGPQTVGELRTRTERYAGLDDPGAIERVLDQLRSRAEPFVVLLPRQPGQKEQRWNHLLGGARAVHQPNEVSMPSAPVRSASAPPPRSPAETPAPHEPAVAAAPAPAPAPGPAPAPAPAQAAAPNGAEVASLRAEVAKLNRDIAQLYELLGEDRPQ